MTEMLTVFRFDRYQGFMMATTKHELFCPQAFLQLIWGTLGVHRIVFAELDVASTFPRVIRPLGDWDPLVCAGHC